MDYEDMTVSEIDDILDVQGLSKDGLKQDKIDRLMDAENPEQETPEAGRDKPEVIKGKAVIESLRAEKPYSVRLWAGKIPVYVCNRCKVQMDSEDQIILHVVKHYPKNQQNDVFDFLVKELGHE